MVDVTSGDTISELLKVSKVQGGIVPRKLGNEIIPTVEINPTMCKPATNIATASVVNGTTATFFTTKTNQDFYITAMSLSYIKDVTATATVMRILANVSGLQVSIFYLPGITLTAGQGSITLSLGNHPIKVDRGTAIALASNTNVANITVIGTIYGYYDESSNG
jgi:hypothetical protein